MNQVTLTLFIPLVLLASGCSAKPPDEPGLRLGYFANLTHAPAILGLADGSFADALGTDVKLTTRTFNAGPAAVEALFTDAIDAVYIGPNPAINAYQKSHGQAVRVIAGAASGGAALVVRSEITRPEELRGKKLATPQFGNTQDVALRVWLRQHGLSASVERGGDVSILPQENAQTLETFRAGQIDGAWVPEPWASRLVIEANGRILVDDPTVTTVLVVRTEYLDEHPDIVERLVRGHLRAIERVNREPAEAQLIVNAALAQLTGKALRDEVLRSAWSRLTFTADPQIASLEQAARAAKSIGFLQTADIGGIVP